VHVGISEERDWLQSCSKFAVRTVAIQIPALQENTIAFIKSVKAGISERGNRFQRAHFERVSCIVICLSNARKKKSSIWLNIPVGSQIGCRTGFGR